MQFIHSDQQLYSNTSFVMTSQTNDLLNALKNIDFAVKEVP